MEEKTILKLSDLRDELCDIIAQIKKEDSDNKAQTTDWKKDDFLKKNSNPEA